MSPDPALFHALLASLGDPPCDLVLAGDGSGGKLGDPCGWCVHMMDMRTEKTLTITGAASAGTSNYAELYPYVHALWLYESCLRKKSSDRRVFDVLIVTDSELTARCGSGEYTRSANLSLWAAIGHFESEGYRIAWRSVKRNTSALGEEADRLAGEARKAIKAVP